MGRPTLAYASLAILLTGCSDQPRTVHVRPSEESVVNRALDIEANGRVSREYILRTVDPVVVYLPNMTCVGLNLRKGVAGGDTTICFDGDGKKVLHYVNGD